MQKIVAVSNGSDVYHAKVVAREMSERIGFDSQVSEEIVLVVNELATNLVRHAGAGDLILTPVFEDARKGIQIETRDRGPGIENVEEVFADGYSTLSGPGYGFGTINRLVDELNVSSAGVEDGGLHVTCRRWVKQFERPMNSFAIGVASRPHPLMQVNGDSFVVKQWEESALVAVIDGLGHGPEAHRAAETARQYVEKHFDSPLASMFLGVSRTCVATRGVVMAVARFDGAQDSLKFASLGNIEARVFNHSEPVTLVLSRGILGHTAKMPVVMEYKWDPKAVLVLHSDGLKSRWQWNDFNFEGRSASQIAQELLLKLARKEDDATVVVVKRAKE